jgi:hypothetical protein
MTKKRVINAVVFILLLASVEVMGLFEGSCCGFTNLGFFASAHASALGEEPLLMSKEQRPQPEDPEYLEVIQKTSAMVWDENAQRLAAEYGLQILNVTWEDTGRYYNSSVGPNISDVTIQVQYKDRLTGDYNLTLMPVIRYPNFTDLTADISPENFYLLVGNEKGESLQRISLSDYLRNFRIFLNDPQSWTGRENSLLAKRDTHVLVSAQAAFLPIPKRGSAEFNPVIFNYQSYAGDPAVLTIVATREGTSATVIDNVRDAFPAGFSWGQRLFFNQKGERASFTGERISDFTPLDRETINVVPEAGDETGLNMVMIIQVPLKQKHPMGEGLMLFESSAAPAMEADLEKSDVETAVIGHGAVEGPFTEIDGLKIERDERFPIRVTVQFYKATSNGVVSPEDMAGIAAQVKRVYTDADYVGSLVVDSGKDRPTEYDGPKVEPEGWWETFWQRFEGNTGLDRFQSYDLLNSLNAYARRWINIPE